MVNMNYRGIMPPVFTPFNADFTINYDVIPKYVKYLHQQHISGILVNGTSGEGMSMSVDERKMVAEQWTKSAHEYGMHVMVQVGGAPMPNVIALAKHAESIKVDSILCLPELFTKPTSVDELVMYLKMISQHSPNTPFLYYHNPGFTCVNLDMAELVRKAKQSMNTFKGLKYTSTDLKMGIAVRDACEDDCAVFLGADQLLVSAFAMGYDSSIGTTYNMMSSIVFNIVNNVSDKMNIEIQNARKHQDRLTKAIDCISKHGKWVATMKPAMEMLTGIKVGPPRPPLQPLTKLQIDEIRADLDKLGFTTV